MPVPAGISLPMITFSLRPSSPSERPSIAASVSTRVVSWNDAADSHESVASDAFVIPISSARPRDGHPPQHLPNDHLDVLVVDRHALVAVHPLHLVDQVLLRLAHALDLEELLRVERALLVTDEAVAGLHVLAVAHTEVRTTR